MMKMGFGLVLPAKPHWKKGKPNLKKEAVTWKRIQGWNRFLPYFWRYLWYSSSLVWLFWQRTIPTLRTRRQHRLRLKTKQKHTQQRERNRLLRNRKNLSKCRKLLLRNKLRSQRKHLPSSQQKRQQSSQRKHQPSSQQRRLQQLRQKHLQQSPQRHQQQKWRKCLQYRKLQQHQQPR